MIIFDVTAREKYKEELYSEKELLRLTLESIGDGVVTTDTNCRVTFMNRAAQKITGWDESHARAASIAAFSGRIFVWKAISGCGHFSGLFYATKPILRL